MTGKVLMGRLGTCFLTWRRWLAKEYARHGLSLKQAYLLNHLERVEYLHPAEIAELLFCDRPTATVIIRNMEREGLISRVRDPENGKRFRIVMTDNGLKKVSDLKNDPLLGEKRFDPAGCFSDEEKAVLGELLARLSRHFESLPGDG